MSTIEIEQKLAKLNLQIQSATNRAANLRAQADKVVGDLRKRGISLDSPDAQHLVGTVEGRLEGVADEITNLRATRQTTLEEFANLVPGGHLGGTGGAGGRGMPLAFGVDQLRDAIEQGALKHPVSIGATALDSSAVPMSDVADFRVNDIWPFLRERPSIFNLFPVEGTDRNQVTVYRGSVAADAAAPVAAGALKPTSSPEWEPVNLPVEVIAHIGVVNLQVLQDFGNAFNVIGSEFMAGLLLEIDAQILGGSGVSPALQGILGSGITSITRDETNESRHNAILRGLTAVRLGAKAEATVIVLHPTDLLLTMVETSTISTYLSPTDTQEIPNLWGVPIVTTTAMDQGTALVANPEILGRIFLRQAPTLEINPWSESEWTRNQASIRNEARLAFGVVRPEAACSILNFGA